MPHMCATMVSERTNMSMFAGLVACRCGDAAIDFFNSRGSFSFTQGNPPSLFIPATHPPVLLNRMCRMFGMIMWLSVLILGRTGFRWGRPTLHRKPNSKHMISHPAPARSVNFLTAQHVHVCETCCVQVWRCGFHFPSRVSPSPSNI